MANQAALVLLPTTAGTTIIPQRVRDRQSTPPSEFAWEALLVTSTGLKVLCRC